jgi:hypothetical protein
MEPPSWWGLWFWNSDEQKSSDELKFLQVSMSCLDEPVEAHHHIFSFLDGLRHINRNPTTQAMAEVKNNEVLSFFRRAWEPFLASAGMKGSKSLRLTTCLIARMSFDCWWPQRLLRLMTRPDSNVSLIAVEFSNPTFLSDFLVSPGSKVCRQQRSTSDPTQRRVKVKHWEVWDLETGWSDQSS